MVFKKEDRLYMKSPTPEVKCTKSVFQIQSPICGVNFSNNLSVNQVSSMRGKTNLTRLLRPPNNQFPRSVI